MTFRPKQPMVPGVLQPAIRSHQPLLQADQGPAIVRVSNSAMSLSRLSAVERVLPSELRECARDRQEKAALRRAHTRVDSEFLTSDFLTSKSVKGAGVRSRHPATGG